MKSSLPSSQCEWFSVDISWASTQAAAAANDSPAAAVWNKAIDVFVGRSRLNVGPEGRSVTVRVVLQMSRRDNACSCVEVVDALVEPACYFLQLAALCAWSSIHGSLRVYENVKLLFCCSRLAAVDCSSDGGPVRTRMEVPPPHTRLNGRILSRRHGATLCYTPMFHAKLFSESEKYRQSNFSTNTQDRPLIVQFCANDPDFLLAAALHVEGCADAVDINLGCPQAISKRDGAYLMEEWPLIASLVTKLATNLSIPVTCKIRIFNDPAKTLAYALMLQEAGCKLLTVHGRTRDQKGHNTGIADWEQIKMVKNALTIPVIANGNVVYHEDVARCLEMTGCDGVMTAGNLYNPGIFEEKLWTVWEMAEEYLAICIEEPGSAEISQIRSHLFKIFKPCLSTYTTHRTLLSKIHTIPEFLTLTLELKELMREEHAKCEVTIEGLVKNERGLYDIPMWYCQGYIRPVMVENSRKNRVAAENANANSEKRACDVNEQDAKKAKIDGEIMVDQ